jgi:hypothetical protein
MYPFRTLPRRHQAPDANSLQTKSGRCPARTGDLLLVRHFGARNGGAWPVWGDDPLTPEVLRGVADRPTLRRIVATQRVIREVDGGACAGGVQIQEARETCFVAVDATG